MEFYYRIGNKSEVLHLRELKPLPLTLTDH